MERTTLITGASDGIGLALAQVFQARGERPYLHGRRPLAKLEGALFEPDHYLRADLADATAAAAIATELEVAGVRSLDLLVLNAAQGWYGLPEDQSYESVRALFQTNLVATMGLCHALCPLLRRAHGRIVFVSSVVAALPSPLYAVYAATKAAGEGFFRALRIELQGEIEVQVIRPGATRSGMHQKSGATREDYEWERFPTPDVVARAIDRAIAGPAHWRTVGTGNRLLRSAGRNLPRVLERIVARGLA